MQAKLGVVLPWSSPFMFTRFVESALNLRHPDGVDVQWFLGEGWSPACRHQRGTEKALTWGADWVVILGSDQVYEPDLLCRLMARTAEGCDVISALVPARGFVACNQEMLPFQKMAWRFKGSDDGLACRQYRGQEADGDMVEVINSSDGALQKIHFIGSGVLCFHRDIILSLKRPWFYETVDHESQIRTACMDTRAVFRMINEAGVDVWVDTTIQVKHLHIFAIDETFPARFADWATPGQGDPSICTYVP